jgi:arylsulfatase A-like enzyme
LAGIPLDGGQYQGHDLLSNAPGHDAVLAEYGPPQAVQVYDRLLPDFDYSRFDRALRSARTTRWKYILASDGQEELYDLEQDPNESSNLAGERPEVCAELRARIQDRLPDREDTTEGVYTAHEEAAILAHLRELGYA